jgi:ABC-2 type transport system permease protein
MSAIRFLRQTLAAALTIAIYAIKNYPIYFVSSSLSVFGLLVFVSVISQGYLMKVGILGALLSSIIYAGTGLQGDVTHLKRDIKFQYMLVSSPVSLYSFIVGISLAELIYELPNIAILVVLIWLYVKTTLINYLLIFVAIALMFVFLSSISFFLSSISRDIVETWAYSSLFSTLLSLISPVYYPLTLLPAFIRNFAFISPGTYPAILAQYYAGTVSYPQSLVLASWIVLIALATFSVILAISKASWREN